MPPPRTFSVPSYPARPQHAPPHRLPTCFPPRRASDTAPRSPTHQPPPPPPRPDDDAPGTPVSPASSSSRTTATSPTSPHVSPPRLSRHRARVATSPRTPASTSSCSTSTPHARLRFPSAPSATTPMPPPRHHHQTHTHSYRNLSPSAMSPSLSPLRASAPPAPSPTESLRRPFLYHAKFGAPSNWALDIFALPHNAVRAECVHLYNILESMHARSHAVDAPELDEFWVWWAAFEAFLIEYFDFEADVLFAWVFPTLPLDSSQSDSTHVSTSSPKLGVQAVLKSTLLARKEPLLESLRQINGTFELRRHVDVADVFHTILQEVDHFVPDLMDYFHIEERHLPPVIAHLHSEPHAKTAITKRYIAYIKHGEDPAMNLALLLRWMDRPIREAWIRANLKGFTRLMYPRWERRCQKEHVHIPYRFHRRLVRSVRSVAASRLRRRTEFGEEIHDLSFGSVASPTGSGSFRSLSLAIGNKSSSAARLQRSREGGSRSKVRIR